MGSNEIIWVEGATEAEAFPKILIAGGHRRIPQFMSMKNTGDFQKKKSQISLIFDIYRKMSVSSAVLPAKVRFGFDRETLSESEQADIRRETKGDAYFTERRLFENYILHAEAIHRVICKELGESDTPSLQAVRNALDTSKDGFAELNWESNVDGAKLLTKIFSELTGARLEFSKPRHPVMILEEIISYDLLYLDPLRNYIRLLVDDITHPSSTPQ